jgi:hypothetical protein
VSDLARCPGNSNRIDGVIPIIWRFFLPRETLKTVPPKTQRLYEKFAAAGALTLTPGNVADYDFIEKQIMADSAIFRITALGIDRWNATDLASRLLNREGLPVELFGQGFASMSGPSKDFERQVLGLGIEHGNNPVVRWMAENVAVDEDAADNIKPTKERSAGKIDGIVSAVMGRGMAMAKPGEPESIYDKEARERAWQRSRHEVGEPASRAGWCVQRPTRLLVVDWFSGGHQRQLGVAVNAVSAQQSSAVFACVQVRSQDIAKLPLILYQRTPMAVAAARWSIRSTIFRNPAEFAARPVLNSAR